MSEFRGFPKEGISFFRGLARNNRREWFQARKEVFEEQVRRPMCDLVNALNQAMMEFAPDYVTDPAKAIYRIYRDTRFSADKTPYKTHIAASFTRRGLVKHQGAGYYFSVSDREIEVGGGVYLPLPETLLAIRTHIAEHHEEFRRLSEAREVRRLFGEMQGERLSRVPKGFASDHSAADLLRHKQFLFYIVLEPDMAATPRLLPDLVKRFRAMTPWIAFLNAPVVAERKAAAKLAPGAFRATASPGRGGRG